MEFLVPVFIVGVLLMVVLAIVAGIRAEKKRKEAFNTFAAELGLEYSESLGSKDLGEFQRFKLADKGRSRKQRNVIVADSGELRMVIFDYQYTTGSGKNSATHRQSVVLSTAPALGMPGFSLSPETFMHRIGDFFGFKDIDFDEDPAFSDKFLLHGESEEAVRGFFNENRRKAFMEYQDVFVEGHGRSFIFYRPNRRTKTEEIKGLMERAFSIYGILGT